jgi:hypothetical protein
MYGIFHAFTVGSAPAVLNYFCAMGPFESLVKLVDTFSEKNVFKCIK